MTVCNYAFEIITFTENIFPMCGVGIFLRLLCRNGSHIITLVSSEPDANNLYNLVHYTDIKMYKNTYLPSAVHCKQFTQP